MSRCLYNSSFTDFLNTDDNTIFGVLCDRYHGEALTTTREAWKSEISIMKDILVRFANKDGQLIFEYDIPSSWQESRCGIAFRRNCFLRRVQSWGVQNIGVRHRPGA